MSFKVLAVAFVLLLLPGLSRGQDFRKWEEKIAELRQWLELVRSDSYRLWVRVDGSYRPYRLYVGDGFYRADQHLKEEFVDAFSRYLAGHPEKFMLIDIFDAASGIQIGEFGWGGFKLYSNSR